MMVEGSGQDGLPDAATRIASRYVPTHPPLTVPRDMKDKLAPHLANMTAALKSKFPHLEPEAVLTQFLCERHHIPAPTCPPLPPRALGSGTTRIRPRVERPSLFPSADRWRPQPWPREAREAKVSLTSDNVGSMDQAPGSSEDQSAQRGVRNATGKMPRLMQTRRVAKRMQKDSEDVSNQRQTFRRTSEGIRQRIANIRHTARGNFLNSVPILSADVLSNDEQLELAGRMRPRNFPAGAKIVDEGDFGDELFIVENGVCQISRVVGGVEKLVDNVSIGGFFGQLSAVFGSPRSATVVAATDCTLLSLSREDIHATLGEATLERMTIVARTQIFDNIPVFSCLPSEFKIRLAASLRLDHWSDGAMIVKHGDRVVGSSRRLYILEKGVCVRSQPASEVERHQPGDARQMIDKMESTCYPGSVIGMPEFLYGCRVQQNFQAKESATTLSISFDDLVAMIPTENREDILQMMRRSLRIHRLQNLDPLLNGVDSVALQGLVDSATVHTYKKWQPIFTTGQLIDRLCLLEEGCCIESSWEASKLWQNVDVHAHSAERDQPWDSFGTRCLIAQAFSGNSSKQRLTYEAPFTLVAASDCKMLHVPADSLRRLASKYSKPSES